MDFCEYYPNGINIYNQNIRENTNNKQNIEKIYDENKSREKSDHYNKLEYVLKNNMNKKNPTKIIP